MPNLQEIESLLITGSNGFVGRSIVEYLGDLNDSLLPKEVTLVTRHGLAYEIPENLIPCTRVIEQDLLFDWQLEAEPSHIVNLAADGSKSPYSKESSDSYLLLNKNLVNWICKQRKAIRIFHASSGACFGHKPLTPGIEPSNTKEMFTEARIKVEKNLMKISRQEGIQVIIGRLFSFTGVNLLSKNQYAVTSFIKSALSENKIKVLGDPFTLRSYLHQDAMSEWILKGLVSPEPNPYFQIGSNNAVTIKQLAEYIAQETNAEIEYSEAPPSGDIYIPDNSETRVKLGVEEGKAWQSAVLEMITEARSLNDVTE